MKPNSGLVAALLIMFSVKSIAEIPVEQYDHRVANKLAESMTEEASDLIGVLTRQADVSRQPVYLACLTSEWESAGFADMNEDERMIFRRLHEHYGREVSFTEDGLIISPKSKPKSAPVVSKKTV
jgi:predicted nucleotidyltransferase